MIWLFIFIVSWGIGAIVCGIAIWFKKKTFAKYAAFIFFGLPVLGLSSEMIHQKMISHNYHAAVEEVKALCAKDGGDKIYKTVDNVQGVFQMRLRKDERQKGLRDQFGMFDPYGYAQGDQYVITQLLAGTGINPISNYSNLGRYGYWFLEQLDDNALIKNQSYIRTYLFDTGNKHKYGYFAIQSGDPIYIYKKIGSFSLKSRYGYLTEDLTTKEMRDHWIGAGRIKIIDLQTNEVLAERKGYFRASGDMLPDYADRWSSSYECEFKNPGLLGFLHSALKPPQDFPTSEQLESIAKD